MRRKDKQTFVIETTYIKPILKEVIKSITSFFVSESWHQLLSFRLRFIELSVWIPICNIMITIFTALNSVMLDKYYKEIHHIDDRIGENHYIYSIWNLFYLHHKKQFI